MDPTAARRTAPASTGPPSTDPASTDPASTDPASTDPASTGPASTGPASTGPASTGPRLDVLDWRRRVAALYAVVRESAASDPAAAHAAWRAGRDDLFATHPASPLLPAARETFGGIPVAGYDPDLRFEAEVEACEPEHLEVATGTDGVAPFDRVGRVRLDGLGDLDVWWLGSYGGGLFVPLRDAGAGTASYGGGRYLLDTVKGADLGGSTPTDGAPRLVLDLNFAYHPSCAYDPAWACPLAPPGNRLDAVVAAGELLPDEPWY